MPADPEAPRLAMRQLWEECDTYLREAIARDEVIPIQDLRLDITKSRVETPGGLSIVRFGDLLEVSADFEEHNNGRTFDATYEVDFPADIRELPTVYRFLFLPARAGRGERCQTETVARKKFPQVARRLGALVRPAELTDLRAS